LPFDKNFLFANEIRENLRLCAVTGCIPIFSRDGYQTAIILWQQTIWIQVPDTGRIVKAVFFFKQTEMLDFKAKAAGLQHIRLWNLWVFARTERDQQYLIERVDKGALRTI
jgi:hypothetical protein